METRKIAWCAEEDGGPNWIQVDMGRIMKLTKIGTQGLINSDKYVTSYYITHSKDRENWDDVMEGEEIKVCLYLL